MAASNQPGKTMSSRLMTMKFMQRGTASPNSAPSTPETRPSVKRQRLSNGSFNSTAVSTPASDTRTLPQTPTTEARKVEEGLGPDSDNRGETKWYLSVQTPQTSAAESPFRIVSAGYSTVDLNERAEDMQFDREEADTPGSENPGRRKFGNFKSGNTNEKDPTSDSEASVSQDEDETAGASTARQATRNRSDSHRAAGEKLRGDRNAKRKAENSRSNRLAEDRRNKHVKLNELTSISSAGQSRPNKRNR